VRIFFLFFFAQVLFHRLLERRRTDKLLWDKVKQNWLWPLYEKEPKHDYESLSKISTLPPSWLPVLEKELAALSQSGGVHENFCLWLTTEHHQKFSAILLQGSLKITYKAPSGVKKNLMVSTSLISLFSFFFHVFISYISLSNFLQRTYDSWGPEYVNNTPMRAQALFVLSWFNAIIQ
jgi:hypothetical protein